VLYLLFDIYNKAHKSTPFSYQFDSRQWPTKTLFPSMKRSGTSTITKAERRACS